jgi:hypothetical protein
MNSFPLHDPDKQVPLPATSVLNSWKEIASYLGRGVRTVQRWEHDLGLPVHRPKGRDRSAVLAISEELNHWLHSTPVRCNCSVGSSAADDSAAVLLELARDLQDFGERLVTLTDQQHRADLEKLVVAVHVIVRELELTGRCGSGKGDLTPQEDTAHEKSGSRPNRTPHL